MRPLNIEEISQPDESTQSLSVNIIASIPEPEPQAAAKPVVQAPALPPESNPETIEPKIVDAPNERRAVPLLSSVRQFSDTWVAEERNERERQGHAMPVMVFDGKLSEIAGDIIENDDGTVAVTTHFIGKPVCYEFDATGDPPLAFFKPCPTPSIELSLDRQPTVLDAQ